MAPDDSAVAVAEQIRRELTAHALADETRRSYRSHQNAWHAWCADNDVDPATATPTHVAQHLATYLVVGVAEGAVKRDQNNKLVAAVATATLEQRLAAIDRHFDDTGRARPGRSREIRTLMEGVRRMYGVDPQHAKRPVMLRDLRAMVTSIQHHDVAASEDLILLTLRRTHRATPGQLARLNWADVELGEGDAYLSLPPDRRGGPRRRVRLRPSRTPDRCPVAALRRLHVHAAGTGAVFGVDGTKTNSPSSERSTRPSRRAVTRQAIDKRLRKLETGRSGAESTTLRAPEPATKALRDVALLTCGWFAALRRSNLAALRWSDVAFHENGDVRIRLRRSKTDQVGQGAYNWLPLLGEDPVCPATALSAWRDRVATLVGGDPALVCPEGPVFPSMNRHDVVKGSGDGHHFMRGQDVADIIQDLAIQIGITARPEKQVRNCFGGHSLRAGWVTEAVQQGIPALEIAAVTHHRDPRSLAQYHRPHDTAPLATVRKVVDGARAGTG